LNSIHFADGQNGWAVGYGGTILRTIDGGRTWGLQNSGTTDRLYSVHFPDPQTGYIVGKNGTILKTTSGGGNTLYPPTLVSPLDASIDVSPTTVLSWNARPGATSYRLQVSASPDFRYNLAVDRSGITETSYQVTGLSNSTPYYWRVNATYADGTSNWSDPWSFTTVIVPPSAPTLSSPSNGAMNQLTTLSLGWRSVEGARSYRLQMAKDSEFATVVLDDSSITWSSKQVGPLETNTTYYWRVKAKNAFVYGPWSDVWNFTTISGAPPSPTLSYPSDGVVDQLQTLWLGWNAAPGVASYHLQVATDVAFTIRVVDDSSITDTSRQLRDLAINTSYYWRVRAKNALGASPWSTVWRFSTISGTPPIPTLRSPADDATNQMTTLRLDWNSSSGAASYRLQVATDSVFTAMVVDDSAITYTSRWVEPLAINTTYYWRVKAKNVIGVSPWSSVWRFTTISGAPSAPTLSWPSNGAVSQQTTLTLRWNSTAGVESYRLQVATDSIFTATVFDDSSITWTSRQVEPLTISTTYYWRVRAKNSIGSGPWSSVWRFTTISAPSAPTLASPSNGAVNQPTTLTLRWNSTAGAESYRLQVATDSIFTAIVFDDSSIAWTSRQVGSLTISTTYYWRVRARNSIGSGPWSSVWRFTTISAPSAPALAWPSNGAVNQLTTLTLRWNSTAGAESYRLQVATDSIFTATVFDDSSITWTSRQVGPLIISTTYYWRVRAKSSIGSGTWSSVWRFTTISAQSAPTLASPSNGAVKQPTTLALRWNPSSGAATYRLQVSTSSAFGTTIVDDSTITTTSRQVGPLTNNTTYYWRVKAKNAGGASEWSTVWNFTTIVAAPSTPTLASPSSGAVSQPTTLTLKWNSSTGATTYHLQVSTSSAFATPILDDSTITATSQQVGSLKNNTTYYWRVNAKNAGGTSVWSTVWSFTTIVAEPSTPTLASPSNGAVSQPTTLVLRWNPSSGSATYRLQVSTSSAFATTIVDDSSITTTFRQVGPLADNITHYWRVKAKNAGGASAWSTVWSFTTIMQAQINFWQETSGPRGGNVVALAINSTGHVFAGNGGVFRSMDNGDSWTAVNNGLTNPYVNSLAINSSGHTFAGVSGGVFRSMDNGDSWTAVNNGLTDPNVGTLAINSSGHIFAGTLDSGVFRSTNNGNSWTAVNTGLTKTGYAWSPLAVNASGHIFVGSGGVFRSTNNGDSWTNLNFPSPPVVSFAINSDGDIFAGTIGHGIFRSMDNGGNWIAVNTGLPDFVVWSLAINSSGHIFAGTWRSGVFRSMDNGDSWIPVNAGLTNTDVRSFAINASGVIFAGTNGSGVFGVCKKQLLWKKLLERYHLCFLLSRTIPTRLILRRPSSINCSMPGRFLSRCTTCSGKL